MANELQFYGTATQSGLTVVARVYNSAGSQIGADISCAEIGVLSIYIGDMPAAAAGVYGVRFVAAGEYVGQGCISWDGTQEVTELSISNAFPTPNQIATSVEQALLNESDGTMFVSQVTAAIRADIERPAGLLADKPSISDMEASSALTATANVSNLATTAQLSSQISALNNVSTADINASLQSYDAATKAELDAAESRIIAAGVPGIIDANIVQVNSVEVTGTGSTGDEWGPV